MANSLKALPVSTLTGSFSTIYTVPSGTLFTVAMLHFVNTSPSPVTVRVCLVPDGGTAQQSNAIMWDVELAGYDFLEMMKGDIWPAGTTLQALAGTTNVIGIKLSGVEST